MGMSDKKTTSNTKQTSTSKLSDWSMDQYTKGQDDIMGIVNDFNTKTPYVPYAGDMVAGLSTGQQKARDYATQNLGSNVGLFDDAEELVQEGASATWDPEDVSYRTFDPDRIEARLNPYRTNVVDAAGAFVDEARDREIAANQARATQAGSYGGSRHGVFDAELARTAAMDKSALNADLLYKGWDAAVTGDERESQGIFGADTFNAGRRDDAAKWKADNAYRGAGALSDLATKKQSSWMNEVTMMEALGATEREIEQATLLAERAKYDDAAADQWKRLQLELETRIGLFGATPMMMDTTSTGSSTSKTSDPIGTLSSLASAGGGLFGGLGSFFKPAASG